ncbi:hypothetical protein [Sphingopyxis granuli]|uniref:Secreted protein n=1 Tax=Sphingopyxis granuli TaxID=267128 RepID=A0AA86GRE1_9SPHN|nr:hypothetical protein [Sphingopyxis granuli]AMG75422.1 Uncharacterized protein SGRAN_3075 [Sphingopyxis granuli]
MPWRHSATLVGALMLGSGAAAEAPAATPYVDLIGRLENLHDYQSTNDPDDVLGHGWMTARLHVSRVLSGQRLARVITVRYFGHTHIRDGRKMRWKLRRGDDGTYLICVPPGSVGVQCP